MTMELSPPRLPAGEAERLGEALRTAMREIATSVAVVTAGAGRHALGATVTSVTSASLAPPILVVSLNRQLRVSRAIRAAGAFRISFLSDRDEDVARAFSGQIPACDRFRVGDWDMDEPGGPLLRSALAGVLCRLTRAVPCGSHDLLLGLAEDVRAGAGAPLLYRRGRYE